MPRSSLDVLPELVKLEISRRFKNGSSLHEILLYIKGDCGRKISRSALSRWLNNPRAQAMIDATLMTQDMINRVADGVKIDSSAIYKLYGQLVSCHLLGLEGREVTTKDLLELGRTVQLVGDQEKQVAVEKPPPDGEAALDAVRKLVAGS